MRYQKFSIGQVLLLVLPGLAAAAGCVFRLGPFLGILPGYFADDLTLFFMSGLFLCAILLLWCFSLHDMLLQQGARRFIIFLAVISVLCTLSANVACLYGFSPDELILLYLPCLPVPIAFIITLLTLFGILKNISSQSDLLRVSVLPLRLLDKDGETVFASDTAQPMDPAVRTAILSNRTRDTTMMNGDFGITVRPISGGWLLEEKDLHDQNALQNELDVLENQLSDFKRAVLRRDQSLETLRGIRESLPELTDYFAPVSDLLRKASKLLSSAASPDIGPAGAKRAYRAAMVYLASAAGYAVLYRKHQDRMEISDFCAILEKPLQVVGAMGVTGSLRNIAKGTCSRRSLAFLYRIENDLILHSMEHHWDEIGFQFRNDERTLRAICAISTPDWDYLSELIREYQRLLPGNIGRIRGGNEKGTAILYFTLWGRMDSTDSMSAEGPVDIRTLLNMPATHSERFSESLIEEVN